MTDFAITDLVEILDGIDDACRESDFEAARLRVVDACCAMACGAQTGDGRDLLKVMKASESGAELSPSALITYLCGATRSSELDDIHTGSCTTVSSVIVPVALVAAERLPKNEVTELAFLRAIIAGYEAMIRLGLAEQGATDIYKGIWSTYVTAPFGAAAVTSWLLQLERHEKCTALAIAATRSVGMTGETGGTMVSRWYTLGRASSEGYLAAIAASVGMNGDLGVLERSFAKTTGTTLTLDKLRVTNSSWAINEVDTKPFRTQRQALAAIDALSQMMGGRSWKEIHHVEVGVPAQILNSVNRREPPHDRVTPGVPYLLALQAVNPSALYKVDRRPVLDTSDIRAFIDKVGLHVDDDLTETYPAHWSARVAIEWSDGTTDSREVKDAIGSFVYGDSWDALTEKYERVFSSSAITTIGKRSSSQWLAEVCEHGMKLGEMPNSPLAGFSGLVLQAISS